MTGEGIFITGIPTGMVSAEGLIIAVQSLSGQLQSSMKKEEKKSLESADRENALLYFFE